MRDAVVDIEDRIFEMLGRDMWTPDIAAELGISPKETLPMVLKVIEERGTPNLAAARQAIDRLATIRVI